jgi:hypothetical protein
MAQLNTKVQAFIGETKGTIIGEIATILTILQEEIRVIDPKERPTDNLKISLFFKAIRELDIQYRPLLLQLELSRANKD